MTIGRTARRAGVGVETIRFYERRGLIAQPPKPVGGGFRTYPSETVERIRFIRQAQDLGFSLREAAELLSLRTDPDAGASDIRARATVKVEDITDRIRRLRGIRDALEALIAGCPGEGGLRSCSIMEALTPPAEDRPEDWTAAPDPAGGAGTPAETIAAWRSPARR